jgi:hypothetical protein
LPLPASAAHLLLDWARIFACGLGVTFAATGITQILRTLRLGHAVNNADDVVRRSSILVGFGAACLYAAFGRF